MSRYLSLSRPLLLALLAIAIGATFAIWRTHTASANDPAPRRFTAVQISDGVLFNEGPAAAYLTTLRRGPTSWTPQLRATQQRINTMIMTDPNWSYAFVRRMQSHDPFQVTAAMRELGRLTRTALDSLYGTAAVDQLVVRFDSEWVNERVIKGAIMHNQFAFHSGHELWFALDVAVAAEVAVVAVVAAVLVAVVGFGTPDAVLSPKTLLAKEILAREIAYGLPVWQ